jgi:hypothetical protein
MRGGNLAILRDAKSETKESELAKLPAAAAHLDEAREEILAFTAFPREVWRQIRADNFRSPIILWRAACRFRDPGEQIILFCVRDRHTDRRRRHPSA